VVAVIREFPVLPVLASWFRSPSTIIQRHRSMSQSGPVFEGKGKAIPLQTLTGPEGSRKLRLPDFKTIGTWRWQCCQPYAPAARKYFWYSFWLAGEGPSAAGRIMSMKNSNDTIGNRSRHLPVCSAVPQPPHHRVPPGLCLMYINLQKPELQSWVYPKCDIINFITRPQLMYFLIATAFFIEDSTLSDSSSCYSKLAEHTDNHWRTQGGFWELNLPPPPPPKFRSFEKAWPNSQFRWIYICNNLIRRRVSLIYKLSETPN
jgi:hypothetical protein